MATDMNISAFRQGLEEAGAGQAAIRVYIRDDSERDLPKEEAIKTVHKVVDRVAPRTGDDPASITIDEQSFPLIVRGPGRLLLEVIQALEISGVTGVDPPQARTLGF